MTAVWRCAEVNHDATEHDTEGEAMAAADELARLGKVAIVWPVEVCE